MKIAILTQPLNNNYGCLLQNYALQTFLQQHGHEVVTLNLGYKKPHMLPGVFLYTFLKRAVQKLLGNKDIIILNPVKYLEYLNRPGPLQKSFINRYILKSDVTELSQDFCSYNDFEAYIVGSDQVWRPRFSPCLTNYYLDFTSHKDVKRIAFAASFGVDNWEAGPELTPLLRHYAGKFHAISVRERSGVDLCKRYLNADAVQVIDPTLLLCADDYMSIVRNSGENRAVKGNLLVYILDKSGAKSKIVDSVCKMNQLQPFCIGTRTSTGYSSVEEWLNGFDKAAAVVTDSYHGIVFSILFKKPFLCIGNENRGLTRFSSLLDIFDLASRLVLPQKLDDSFEMFKDWPDSHTIDEILTKQVESAQYFIDKALGISNRPEYLKN